MFSYLPPETWVTRIIRYGATAHYNGWLKLVQELEAKG